RPARTSVPPTWGTAWRTAASSPPGPAPPRSRCPSSRSGASTWPSASRPSGPRSRPPSCGAGPSRSRSRTPTPSRAPPCSARSPGPATPACGRSRPARPASVGRSSLRSCSHRSPPWPSAPWSAPPPAGLRLAGPCASLRPRSSSSSARTWSSGSVGTASSPGSSGQPSCAGATRRRPRPATSSAPQPRSPRSCAGAPTAPSASTRFDPVSNPVVLVHGFGTSSDRTWRDNGWIDLLQDAGREVVAIDLLGHGRSDKPHDPAAYDDLEALVAAQLPDGPIDGVGFSLGARVLLTLATETPERFASLTLLGVGTNLLVTEGSGLIVDAIEGRGDPANPVVQYFAGLAAQPDVDRAALAACLRSARPALTPERLARA